MGSPVREGNEGRQIEGFADGRQVIIERAWSRAAAQLNSYVAYIDCYCRNNAVRGHRTGSNK